jgi:hypothetical protein
MIFFRLGEFFKKSVAIYKNICLVKLTSRFQPLLLGDEYGRS